MLSFTKKQTDIYTLWQSGDLKNLDGLDKSLQAQLPALHKLRNALYSEPFRTFLSEVTGAGPLSAQKVDMAINVYTPGSHLLAHDDVIGSRRVSYILYLTDPEVQWQSEWGGNLRLYSTNPHRAPNGRLVELPSDDPRTTLHIGWNKMAIFAVQPGKSFHDVEEVYPADSNGDDFRRIRTAISGWYHIPQEGEEGYRDGEAEEHEANSGRLQLKTADDLDRPQPMPRMYPEYVDPLDIEDKPSDWVEDPALPGIMQSQTGSTGSELNEGDLDFLLRYINPRWLVPETAEELKAEFVEKSSLRLADFLNARFAGEVKHAIEASNEGPRDPVRDAKISGWNVALPSHKRHYLYRTPIAENTGLPQTMPPLKDFTNRPLEELMSRLLPSPAFRKWLSFVAGAVLRSHDVRVRRFRRGVDYQLAMPYKEKEPRLELVLGVTPGGKWEDEQDVEEHEMELDEVQGLERRPANGTRKNGHELEEKDPKSITGEDSRAKATGTDLSKPLFSHLVEEDKQETNNGGYEVWMAGEEGDDCSESSFSGRNTSDDGALQTSRDKKKTKPLSDPAVYQAAADPLGDSGVMFSMPAGWNRLSLVLRDRGTLRFVKYVSRSARCDRWDIAGEWGIDWKKTNALDQESEEDDTSGDENAGKTSKDWGVEEVEASEAASHLEKVRTSETDERSSKRQKRG